MCQEKVTWPPLPSIAWRPPARCIDSGGTIDSGTMDSLIDAQDDLVRAMADAARGPKRNGLFAVWLVVRHCAGYLGARPLRERGQRARLAHVDGRLSSLTLPAPLRRALAAAVRELRANDGRDVAVVLQQLVAPARETVGGDAAEAVAAAARVARTAATAARPARV